MGWSIPVWAVVLVCCALPLGWMAVQLTRIAAEGGGANSLLPTGFQLQLLGRTLAYSVLAALLGTLLAIPAGLVLGRGRGLLAKGLWLLLPATLLLPSITYAYGWSQFLRLLDLTPEFGSTADVLRCVWTLAAWLWALPAGVIGLALRRVDVNLQQQALLDGALARITARQLAGPAAAAMACVAVLAGQEFAVYEPTGISVVATEVRQVFETGAFASSDNPITATFVGGAGSAPDGEIATPRSEIGNDQDARAGAAVGTALPLLVVVSLLGWLAARAVGRVSAAEDVDVGPSPRVLEPGTLTKLLAIGVLGVTLVLPAAAMVASLHVRRDIRTIWTQFSPQASGSIALAGCAAAVAAGVAFLAAVRRPRGAMVLSLAAFLAGGQLLAIALIRLYNRPAPWPLGLAKFGGGGGGGRADAFDLIYNGIPIVVMAYLARFGWIALLAAGVTRSRPWRQVRELADLDGATSATAARHVIWPLAWPVLVASALLVGVLSLTEVPATVLISPLRPQPLVPMLMGWVHMLRYDNMIEGSLLLMGMAFAVSVVAAGLIALGARVARRFATMRPSPGIALAGLSALALLGGATGCSDSTEPDEIWLETGTGPGQVVYPRAITYSPTDDSFFIIDRLARIQHLDAQGKPLGEWRMPDWRIGKPVGLSVGPDGNVYVPDTHYHRVVVYSPTGEEIRKFGGRGSGPGRFIWPTDVAFDVAGDVYVSEYGDNDRIQVFAPDGTFRRSFGAFGTGDGQFMRPQSLLIDGDLVYVTDACNNRIAVFRTDGTFVRNMGGVGSGPGEFRFPFGLDLDADGRLVVAEFGNNRVQLIDKETGKGLGVWGSSGRAPGQFAYPWAVALDKAGRVIALDSGNNRIQVFEF